VELLGTQAVVARVREQSLDLGLVYESPRVSDLQTEPVGSVELMLVADRPDLRADESLPGYVSVDWGVPFAMTLARALPDLPDPALRVDAPEVAYDFLSGRGGAAYLPRRSVQDDMEAGRLHPVNGAPVVERPVFLIQNADARVSTSHAAVRDGLVSWLTGGRTAVARR
jgi:DNA-binding transcriptional LysR family regulator